MILENTDNGRLFLDVPKKKKEKKITFFHKN